MGAAWSEAISEHVASALHAQLAAEERLCQEAYALHNGSPFALMRVVTPDGSVSVGSRWPQENP